MIVNAILCIPPIKLFRIRMILGLLCIKTVTMVFFQMTLNFFSSRMHYSLFWLALDQ